MELDERSMVSGSWRQRLVIASSRLLCPAPPVIAAFLDGNLEPKRERRLQAHLTTCRECSLAVKELRQLSQAAVPEVPTSLLRQALQLDGRSGPRLGIAPRWRLAGASAVAGVAVLLGIWLGESGEVGTGVGSGAVRTVRGELAEDEALALVLPNPDAALPLSAVRIEWTEVVGAVRYEVLVVDAEGSLIEMLDAGESQSASPHSQLDPGTYFVSVVATMPDGRIVRSRFSRFTIRPGE